MSMLNEADVLPCDHMYNAYSPSPRYYLIEESKTELQGLVMEAKFK